MNEIIRIRRMLMWAIRGERGSSTQLLTMVKCVACCWLYQKTDTESSRDYKYAYIMVMPFPTPLLLTSTSQRAQQLRSGSAVVLTNGDKDLNH